MSAPTGDLRERIADLGPQWRFAIARAQSRGWLIFPAQDRVRTTPDFDHSTQTDYSKSPRPRCVKCRTAMKAGAAPGAACYAECGHRLCHGFLGATSDVDQLIEWARRYPSANLGLATGRVSNAFVLDEDGTVGEQRLAELESLHTPLPPTRTYTTGGGTRHLIFNYPAGRANPLRTDGAWRNNAKTLLGDGLDTRGEGGYIILPGANSRKGPYRATDDATPQADAPEWLLHLLSTPRKKDDTATRQQRRAAATALTSAVDFTAAGDGLHPYVAKAFADRVAEFRALIGAGNGRTNLLTGGALYLSRLANSTTPSGLTEAMIEDAYTEACEANGYAAEHSDWTTQLANGIRDGRTAGDPSNWPSTNREDPNDALIREVLASGDKDQLV